MNKILSKIRGVSPFWQSAFLGLVYTLSFAPFHLWVLGVACVAGLLFILKNVTSLKKALLIAFVFAVFHHFSALHWLVSSFVVTIPGVWLAIPSGILAVLGISAYFALYTAFAGGVFYLLQKKNIALAGAGFAAVWVLGEVLRGYLHPTFAWNFSVHSLAENAYLLQSIDFLGVFGLSFVLVLLSGLLLLKWKGGLMASLLLALLGGYGSYVLKENPLSTENPEAGLAVSLIPSDVSQKQKWQTERREPLLLEQMERTLSVSGGSLVVWPETAVTTLFNRGAGLRRFMADQMGISYKHLLVVGAPYMDRERRYFNSLYVMGRGGEILYRYDKRYLVPFGEYFPLRDVFPKLFDMFIQGQGEYTSGADVQEGFMHQKMKFYPLICGEIVVPWIGNKIDVDTDYILNITNDAWFAGTIGPAQHRAIVKIQAKALGKPVLRVANHGGAMWVDAFGRKLKSSNTPFNVYISPAY